MFGRNFRAATRPEARKFVQPEIERARAEQANWNRMMQEALTSAQIYDMFKPQAASSQGAFTSAGTGSAGSNAADYTGSAMKNWTAGQGASTGAQTASTGGSASAGASGGAGASGAEGSVAGGPYAMLAAAIIANEMDAKAGGYRRSGSDYWKDLALGKSLSQDLDERIPNALGLKWGQSDASQGAKKMMQGAMNPLDLQAQVKGAEYLGKGTMDTSKKFFDKFGRNAFDPMNVGGKVSAKNIIDPLDFSSALRRLV